MTSTQYTDAIDFSLQEVSEAISVQMISALRALETGWGAKDYGTRPVLTRCSTERGVVCQIDDQGAFTATVDTDTEAKVHRFTPRQTRALWDFWRVLGHCALLDTAIVLKKFEEFRQRRRDPKLRHNVWSSPRVAVGDILQTHPTLSRNKRGGLQLRLTTGEGKLGKAEAVLHVAEMLGTPFMVLSTKYGIYIMLDYEYYPQMEVIAKAS